MIDKNNDNRYDINSFDDLCDLVSSDNVEILSEDLKNWLNLYISMVDLIRKEYPKETEGLKNTQIAKGSFTWIDDGKNDLKEIIINLKK